MKQYIPNNINVELLCSQFPPTNIDNFNKDKLIHIMHLIHSIIATNKDVNIIHGFVPLYSEILRYRIHNYRQYLDYLLSAGIFESDNHYLPGYKSKGYRFTSNYRKTLSAVEITNKTLIRHQTKTGRYSTSMKRKHGHLVKWFTPKLQISRDLAIGFLRKEYRLKTRHPMLRDYDIKNECYKDPLSQFNSQLISVEHIASGEFNVIVDSNVHRLHSNLTNLKSELRHFLLYDGQPLISVDIANSQPYMCIALMNPSFWKPEETYQGMSIKDVGTSFKIQQHIHYIMSHKSKETQHSIEFERYATLVTQDKFYPYLQTLLTNVIGENYNSRKQVKVAVFQVLFTSNKYLNQPGAAPKRVFSKVFPNVHNLFNLIKEDDHTRLPRLLQRVESHLILIKVSKRISLERPDLPIFTIHDSIATTVGNQNYVKQVMEDELLKAIGHKPVLKEEAWDPSLVKLSNGSIFYGEVEFKVA